MRLQILSVGKMKAGPEQELYDRYASRTEKLGRSLHLTGPDLIELSESRLPDARLRKSEEATQLIQKSGSDTRIVVLDEVGKDISSAGFADLIQSEQEAGTRTLGFAIGGPDGHGPEIVGVAVRKVRFGAMTWPHQIVRIMLAEQIYRACTILLRHPYHRE